MNSIALNIAGLGITVESEQPFADGFIGDRIRPFLASVPPAGAHITLRWLDQEPCGMSLGEEVFAPGSVWRMYRPAHGGDGWTAVISYSDDGRLTSTAAVLEVDSGWSSARLTEASQPAPWSSLLNLGAGELLVRTRIILESGLVFHASAIDDSGSGVLMVGHAGAGKSTQATIWSAQEGVVALSDDRVGVRLHDGTAVAYGTPWGGTAGIAKNHSVPLKAILVLEQAPENALVRLSVEDAAPLLLARCFLPFWSESLTETAMDVLIHLLEKTPVYQFRCVPNESVVPVVRAVL